MYINILTTNLSYIKCLPRKYLWAIRDIITNVYLVWIIKCKYLDSTLLYFMQMKDNNNYIDQFVILHNDHLNKINSFVM